MKQKLPLIAAFLASNVAFAQSLSPISYTAKPAGGIDPSTAGVASGTDTLGWDEFQQHNIFLYGSQVGYVFGTSVVADQVQGIPVQQFSYEFAAGHLVNGNYNVIGAMALVGAKSQVSASPAAAKVKLYNLADNKAISDPNSSTPDAIGPNQTLATVSLPWANINIDAQSIVPTFVTFTNPVAVSSDIAIGFDIQDNYASPIDTLALYADENGDADGTYTWTKLGLDLIPQTFWIQSGIMLQGGLNVNVALFPIVESTTSIDDDGFLNGMKLGQNSPNPAVGDIIINYELEKAAKNIRLMVYDATGRLAADFNEGERTKGRHSVKLHSGQLSPGTYFYSLRVGDQGMVKKMVVVD